MMPKTKHITGILALVLGGACGDSAGSTSPASSTTDETGTDSEGTSTNTTASTNSASTTSTTDATDTTGEAMPCPPKIWEGDFIGSPMELAGYTEVTGSLRIDMTSAVDLRGMECLERSGSLSIRDNETLTSLDGVERLAHVGPPLIITNNAKLASIAGLRLLTAVDGRVMIQRNPVLASLHGLEAVTQVGENLSLSENAALVDLQGLESLTTVVGSFGVALNDSLVSCAGPGNLVSVGSLNVAANAELGSLDGLESIRDLGSELRIVENPKLADVTAVAGGEVEEAGEIEIMDNLALPQCDAEALADAVKPPGYTGQEEVTGNQGTCP